MFNKSGSGSGITLIANNCEVSGDLHFSDQLQINGTVKGNIYAVEGSKAVVTVSEKGRVKGEIRVPNVIINGKVHGDVHSDKHIELAAKAEIKGNVFYNLIEMVMGSRVDGNLVHTKVGKDKAEAERSQAESPKTEPPKTEPPKTDSRTEPKSAAKVATVTSKTA
jgi:cytoskeletal protein CcmA (bactofilin family)